MRIQALPTALILTGVMGCLPIAAQHVISAKSGLVHYTEGSVLVGDQPAGQNNSAFQYVANGQELRAGEGRAELLLAPGQFLRLNENSSVRMVSNKLEDTRLEALTGSSMLEVVELQKGTALSITFGKYTVDIRKPGLYRIDTDPGQLRVFKGEALVSGNGQSVTAKEGKEVLLGAVISAGKFDTTGNDEFSRWAERRAGYIATANVSAARQAFSGSGYGNQYGWYYNPWYGMYTFLPGRRFMMSPFGFYYFSPDFAFNNAFWPYFGYGYYGNGYYGSGYGYGYANPGGGATGTSQSSGGALLKPPPRSGSSGGIGSGPRGINQPVIINPTTGFNPGRNHGGSNGSGGFFNGSIGHNSGGGGYSNSGSSSSHVSSGGGSSHASSSGGSSMGGGGGSMHSSAPAASSASTSSSASSHVK
jgi:hypothetical protein